MVSVGICARILGNCGYAILLHFAQNILSSKSTDVEIKTSGFPTNLIRTRIQSTGMVAERRECMVDLVGDDAGRAERVGWLSPPLSLDLAPPDCYTLLKREETCLVGDLFFKCIVPTVVAGLGPFRTVVQRHW